MNRQAQVWLDRFDAAFPPSERVGNLSMGNQQLIEIAKAMSRNAKVLILDEPTSSLSFSEAGQLFGFFVNFVSRAWGSSLFPIIWKRFLNSVTGYRSCAMASMSGRLRPPNPMSANRCYDGRAGFGRIGQSSRGTNDFGDVAMKVEDFSRKGYLKTSASI